MSFEFRSRFLWVLKTAFVVALICGIVYAIAVVGGSVMNSAKQVTCTNNLRRIGLALSMYRQRHNCLPAYLMQCQEYMEDKSVLICPADPFKGGRGSLPQWVRTDKLGKPLPEWRDELDFVDFDGPEVEPPQYGGNDRDSVPCSYFYRFNGYPVDLETGVTFRDEMENAAKTYGTRTPVVSCLWHLPPYPKETDGDSLNLLTDLNQVQAYPRQWTIGAGGQ